MRCNDSTRVLEKQRGKRRRGQTAETAGARVQRDAPSERIPGGSTRKQLQLQQPPAEIYGRRSGRARPGFGAGDDAQLVILVVTDVEDLDQAITSFGLKMKKKLSASSLCKEAKERAKSRILVAFILRFRL
uniref:(northern house mosquito) hypothetical protein n=1 Tax=Culex pipiens TaxID=7175 RepID=A0A8D8NKW2_CULPI